MSNITISLPDGSQRALPEGATALDVAASIGRDSPRRRSPPTVDGDECRPRPRRCPTARTVAIITADTDDGPPRAAPLDGARHGPGRHAAVPRGQVLDRPGDRERLLLRLRAARRHARSPRTTSRRSRREMREIVKADQPFVRIEMSTAEAHGAVRRPAVQASRSSSGSRAARPATTLDAGEVGGGDDDQRLPQHRRVRRHVRRPARAVAPAGSGTSS